MPYIYVRSLIVQYNHNYDYYSLYATTVLCIILILMMYILNVYIHIYTSQQQVTESTDLLLIEKNRQVLNELDKREGTQKLDLLHIQLNEAENALHIATQVLKNGIEN